MPPTRRDTSASTTSPAEDMASPHARRMREHRRQQERHRRAREQRESAKLARNPALTPDGDPPVPAMHRRAAATTCGWCSGPINPKSRGPVPKWCSASCRQRAWEQRRAAASGLSAVEIVERVVEVPVPPQARPVPRHQEWHSLLRELTRQLSSHLVYERHLAGIASEVRALQAQLERRGMWGDVRWRDVTPAVYTRHPDLPGQAHPGHPTPGGRW